MAFISDFNARTTIDPVSGASLISGEVGGGSTAYESFIVKRGEIECPIWAILMSEKKYKYGESEKKYPKKVIWIVRKQMLVDKNIYESFREIIVEALLSYRSVFGISLPGAEYSVIFEDL